METWERWVLGIVVAVLGWMFIQYHLRLERHLRKGHTMTSVVKDLIRVSKETIRRLRKLERKQFGEDEGDPFDPGGFGNGENGNGH